MLSIFIFNGSLKGSMVWYDHFSFFFAFRNYRNHILSHIVRALHLTD